jgi:hypothetical protein
MPKGFTASLRPPVSIQLETRVIMSSNMHTSGDDPGPSNGEPVAVGAVLLQQLDIVLPFVVRVTGIPSCILTIQ